MASAPGSRRAYADPGYAHALDEFGVPRELRRCGGWVLERSIDGTRARDLTGPYPLFACADWSKLADDVDELAAGPAVSLVVVVDPLAGVDAAHLRRAFPDHLRTFKTHFIRDLDMPAAVTAHHRRTARRAARAVDVEICAEPLERLDDWMRLYDELVARHGLVGVSAFSRRSFRRQLALRGMIALRAVRHGRAVAMALWFEDAPHAHYHLAASSSEGYEVGASYALVDAALELLRARGVRWVDLGGAPAAGARDHGLAYFKRGWANAERPAHLCGRILDRTAYGRLVGSGRRPGRAGGWFPEYRAGEHVAAGGRGASPAVGRAG